MSAVTTPANTADHVQPEKVKDGDAIAASDASPRRTKRAPTRPVPRGCARGCIAGRYKVEPEVADAAGDEPIAEIAVGLEGPGGKAGDGAMAWQIDGIGDDGGSGIGIGGTCRQHGHRIGDAEREAAAAPAAGGDAAQLVGGGERGLGEERGPVGTIDQSDAVARARRQMEGDVAAIVDEGAVEFRRRRHGREDFLGDGARHRRHRRDEAGTGVGERCPPHAAGDVAGREFRRRPAQQGKLGAQFIEDGREAAAGRGKCKRPGIAPTLGADDEVDGPVVKMEPAAIGQEARFHAAHGFTASGQGFPDFAPTRAWPCAAWMSASGWTSSIWPPRRA